MTLAAAAALKATTLFSLFYSFANSSASSQFFELDVYFCYTPYHIDPSARSIPRGHGFLCSCQISRLAGAMQLELLAL